MRQKLMEMSCRKKLGEASAYRAHHITTHPSLGPFARELKDTRAAS